MTAESIPFQIPSNPYVVTNSNLHEDNHNLQPGPGVGHDQGGTEDV